jgi:hypothetical protein
MFSQSRSGSSELIDESSFQNVVFQVVLESKQDFSKGS